MINTKEEFQAWFKQAVSDSSYITAESVNIQNHAEGLDKFDPELARLHKANHQSIIDFYSYVAKKAELK